MAEHFVLHRNWVYQGVQLSSSGSDLITGEDYRNEDNNPGFRKSFISVLKSYLKLKKLHLLLCDAAANIHGVYYFLPNENSRNSSIQHYQHEYCTARQPLKFIPPGEKDLILELTVLSMNAIGHARLPSTGHHGCVYLAVSESGP
ncbi:predicted protein [Histoplasma capsulatum G186AR]|uniref:Uncharacterized protein n=1 Tax=Ajellomyces capsulatus (strain G186AR / H82 / ATCC MYA-2454 / RMSCC 2432) TaxID=447093 RepID=C0NJT3_AJECG|nr:uncharacterized protein HCBG_03413 [Histoplasma capsulatum G186AR]EEH08124.1 predicted protein [Histoplasma capsulatum G186AR]